MLSFVAKYSNNIHSQNGEDGILAECVKRLGIEKGHCVEIGANDGLWMSNTRALIEDRDWSGLFVEADYSLYERCRDNWKHNLNVRVQCCKVDEQSVNIFVDDRCDVLSIDTDGADFEVFGSLRVRPKIAVVEVDSSFSPDVTEFNSDGGASYRAMARLGLRMGYFVFCHTGNLIFLRNEFRGLFPEVEGDGLSNAELYFNRSWLRETVAA